MDSHLNNIGKEVLSNRISKIHGLLSGCVVSLVLFVWASQLHAQTPESPANFIGQFAALEGQYFEGEITAGGREGDGFMGNRLLMHVAKVADNELRIPFFVGQDRSRTWIVTTNENGTLKLKHDHRHEDGSPDKITFYGGDAPNYGWDKQQTFPADAETCEMIGHACQNVWWMTMDGSTFTYNLRRIGSERAFTVSFDLSQPVESDFVPW